MWEEKYTHKYIVSSKKYISAFIFKLCNFSVIFQDIIQPAHLSLFRNVLICAYYTYLAVDMTF